MLAPRLINANGNKRELGFIPHHFVNFKNQQELRVIISSSSIEIGATQEHIQGMAKVFLKFFFSKEITEKTLQ